MILELAGVARHFGGVKAVDGTPVITVKIQNQFRKMYKDVRAQLRPSTALQDMFLDITDRGTPQAGKLAGPGA